MKTIALCVALLAVLSAGLTAQDTPAFDGKTAAQWSAAIQKTTDAKARAALVEKLGRPGDKAAPVLIALLDDPDPAVKKFATVTLPVAGWTAIPALEAAGKKGLVESILRQPFLRYSHSFPKDRTYKCGPEPRFDPAATSLECDFWTGRQFRMLRFSWKDGKLTADRISRSVPWRNPEKARIHVASATMSASRAAAMMRAMMTATRVAIATEPGPNESRVGGTSLHFEGRMFIREGETGIFGCHYTNRMMSGFPVPFLQMLLLEGIVTDAEAGVAWTDREATESDRVWLARRLEAASPENGFHINFLNRFAAEIGDKRFVPWFERLIREIVKGHDDCLKTAIDAYAGFTGVDYRPKEFTWKQAHEVRLKYLEHFKQADGDD